MPWPCRMIDPEAVPLSERKPGDMWFAPFWLHPAAAKDRLSPEYFRDHATNRQPIEVMFPGGVVFCIDRKSGDGTGWAITGEPPNITVSPSINHIGKWHGFLTNGVLSDDVEGRRFD